MKFLTIVILSTLSYASAINNKTFPKGFMFGVATSAYQIEGGWNADGKGESVWDHLLHEKPYIVWNNDTGDIACDSYHKYKEDIELIKNLGVTHYRFSISWSRILPNGMVNNVNLAGINYYKSLIKGLKENNIQPLVTLHHSDLPQKLEELGGFLNEQIVDWFGDYARLCFETFGNSVKYWMTFNEPRQLCNDNNMWGFEVPRSGRQGFGEYICVHNLLKAHANAYHIYNKEFKPKQNGGVSIVADTEFFQPATDRQEDKEASENKLQFTYGWLYNPVVYGDYPEIMKTKIAKRSKIQGFPRSRLPEFTPEEKAWMKGTHDFVCINHYVSRYAEAIPNPNMVPDWDADAEVNYYQNASIMFAPWGIRKVLNWISKTYGNPEIIITENGSYDSAPLNDDQRILYHTEYMSNVRDAMEYDGVKVFGYTVWTLLDDFEWEFGYLAKLGLHHVDFSSPNRTRTPKKSVGFYKNVIKTRCLVDTCE